MKGLRLPAAVVALSLALVSALAAPALAQEPEEVVRSLYTEPSLSLDGARSSSYFAADLAQLMRLGASTGFDYRYGPQELQVSGLQLVADVDNDRARVVAVFKNKGRANSVDWSLCRRSDGEWRIADAHSNTGPEEWSLRQLLRLPAAVRC